MEKRGLLTAEWAVSEKGRRAKCYEVTAAGRRAVSAETARWGRYVAAVGKVVEGEA